MFHIILIYINVFLYNLACILRSNSLLSHLIFRFFFIIDSMLHKKIPLTVKLGGFRINELAMTYSHMDNSTLPSALRGFTSEFGKGSGGSLLLLSPAQLFMTIRWV